MFYITFTFPFTEWPLIDILRPIPKSYDEYKYIMVVEDYFSKQEEAYCLSDHTVETEGQGIRSSRKIQFVCADLHFTFPGINWYRGQAGTDTHTHTPACIVSVDQLQKGRSQQLPVPM